MNNSIRSLASFILLGLAFASLTACNTISGAGKDVQKAGEVIEDTAEDAKG